jgi:hypothetical protein
MSISLYKSTLNFLISHSKIKPSGFHLHRLNILAGMICSCIRTQSSTLEGISTPEQQPATGALAAPAPQQVAGHVGTVVLEVVIPDVPPAAKQQESRTKQSKRWLDSKWTDWESFYAPYIKSLLSKIGAKGELILIIDGSETAADCVTLMLSVVWNDYAIPLAWITRKGKKGHFPEDTHMELLKKAFPVLPIGCRVVLLGDGEFDGSRLRQLCKSWKWEFVLRTAINHTIDCSGEKAKIGDLYPMPGEEVVFVENASKGDNAILWAGKGFEDPIPLLTNMDLGEMACSYYRKRFMIETLFKQMKSAGFKIHKSKVSGAYRVANLIIVVAFAFVFSFCAGVLLKKQPKGILNEITRFDRIKKMRPIFLIKKCIDKNTELARNIFSNISKNWNELFLGSA